MTNKKAEVSFLVTLFIIIAILSVAAFVGFKTGLIDSKEVKNQIDILKGNVASDAALSSPPSKYDWCKIQTLNTTQYYSNKILGWDKLNNCCVQEYTGFDNCLNKNVSVKRCFIGDVGTIHKWSRINGYYFDLPTDYELSLFAITDESFDCSSVKYPSEVNE